MVCVFQHLHIHGFNKNKTLLSHWAQKTFNLLFDKLRNRIYFQNKKLTEIKKLKIYLMQPIKMMGNITTL